MSKHETQSYDPDDLDALLAERDRLTKEEAAALLAERDRLTKEEAAALLDEVEETDKLLAEIERRRRTQEQAEAAALLDELDIPPSQYHINYEYPTVPARKLQPNQTNSNIPSPMPDLDKIRVAHHNQNEAQSKRLDNNLRRLQNEQYHRDNPNAPYTTSKPTESSNQNSSSIFPSIFTNKKKHPIYNAKGLGKTHKRKPRKSGKLAKKTRKGGKKAKKTMKSGKRHK
jgi:hypothetical protein